MNRVKYKWVNREQHFKILDLRKKLNEDLKASFARSAELITPSWVHSARESQRRHNLIASFECDFIVLKQEMVQSYRQHLGEKAFLSVRSALDGESGTTNPEIIKNARQLGKSARPPTEEGK